MWLGAQFELPQADLSLGDLDNGKNIRVDIYVCVFRAQKDIWKDTPNLITLRSRSGRTKTGARELKGFKFRGAWVVQCVKASVFD